ncbi:Mitochondrial dicarboxylate transporter [Colletotrichum spinosum]|uniref:Mitochondrial dicarboxylate transporter n=1 Tax=Colletotrichum spinosum TaxID=1347390 RepID=A0A4R8QTR4_9PEZI|nr:Mitochondrial dicarboxylate transporter [Colletotrichum spinosum]
MASPAATRSADEASSLKPAQPEIAQKKQTEKKKPDTSMRYPFWFGGSASSMAACVTHPLDLVKVCTPLASTPQTSITMHHDNYGHAQ